MNLARISRSLRFVTQLGRHLSSFDGAAEVSVTNSGKNMQLLRPGAKERTFHSLWLRHSCQCSECTYTSGQRTVHWSELPKDLKIKSATLSGDVVIVKWESAASSCSHTGKFTITWLEENDYSDATRQEALSEEREPIVAKTLPTVSHYEVMSSDEGLWKWLRFLNYYGVCLVEGVPTNLGEIRKVGSRIGNIIRNVYGEVYDVVEEKNPDNVAYTTWKLPLHMDLDYYESSPGVQLMHCIRNDDCVEGGESIVLDLYSVVQELHEMHPHHFDTLVRVPATNQKIVYDTCSSENCAHFVYCRPHIQVNRIGKVVRMHWATSMEGPLSAPQDEIENYFDAYRVLGRMIDESKNKIVRRFVPGDLISFNNHRILHARNEYCTNGGQRHLQGLYLNIDEFKSRFMVLSKILGKKEIGKNVFNQCLFA